MQVNAALSAPSSPQPPELQRCERTELLVRDCAHCRGHDGRSMPVDTEVVRTFTAVYGGTCAGCGVRFNPGDEIGATADRTYVCQDCAS